MKRIAIDAMRSIQRHFGICLIAYVIMPDHLHLVLYPHEKGSDVPVPFSSILHRLKQEIGYYGKQKMNELVDESGTLWSATLDDWHHGRLDKQSIMETRGYDFNIDRHETLLTKIDYCHKNPVTRGLVDRPEQWRWSSYRFYEYDDRSLLEMNWTGNWPILW